MFLEMRQADVANAVGVSVERLSRAERGILVLDDVELESVESFLRERLDAEFKLMAASRNGHKAETILALGN
jgi:transcriptional regulator with XRE-family HTH domain